MVASNFDVSKTAPFADGGRVLMHFVKLNELNWVAETELLNSRASGKVASDLNDWHVVD